MGYNLTKGHIRVLKENYENACNDYLLALLNMWDVSTKDGYWIGDEVGGIYAHGETIFIKMDEIIFCVENNVSMETYMEYSEYCLKSICLL